MIDIDFITLEDGIEYAIVDEIVVNGIKYIYLVDENTNKVLLRKLNENDDLIEVSDADEIKKAMLEFAKIHKNDLA